jgi:lysylphosphatidylglycerol synthetase-like protein (DUF2156 family)
MDHKKISLLIFACLLTILPLFSFADPIVSSANGVISIIGGLTNFLWAIFAAVTVIFFIIAGFAFVTSGGDPTKFEKAKKMTLYGVIGVIVALLAGGMVELITSLLEEAA